MEKVQHLKIPLEDILLATNKFDENYRIGKGGFGRVYKGELLWKGRNITVAVKRLNRELGQGDGQFYMEVAVLSDCIHKNLASLVGFSEENDEKILVYKYENRGSLEQYIHKTDLTWVQRLQISIDTARGLYYLHEEVGLKHRVLHRDIKSANILLSEDWQAKVSDFGLSKIGPANMPVTFMVTNVCGTYGYVDPAYHETGVLTKESDIYSFGVVLFELLCGRPALVDKFKDERMFLGSFAKHSYEGDKLDYIIDPNMRKQMNKNSLNTFSAIAYQCLKDKRNERPTMGDILRKLEKALEQQDRGDAPDIAVLMDEVEHLMIPLQKIILATNNFDEEKNFIAKAGFGRVYKGELLWSGQQVTIVVKRFDHMIGQGDQEFLMEITMLSAYRHRNIASLVGFCDEGKEKILVYKHESRGSLDQHVNNAELNWIQRLQISIGAAQGLKYLHEEEGPQHKALHRDIKSANILLNEDWEAKVSDFGLSKIGPTNMEFTFLASIACHTFGYLDPDYYYCGILTKESDIYSFGVVLFEILCGRLAYVERFQDERKFLGPLARHSYEQDELDEIIDPNLRKQMNVNSLNTFSAVAYQCLSPNRSERPTMAEILEKLEKALEQQDRVDAPDSVLRMEKIQHLKIPLKNILQATNNFNEEKNFIAKGGFGRVYKGKLLWSDNSLINVAVKRFDLAHGHGDREFLMEITMLSSYKHKNLISLVGFCDESKEKVLVYVHESRGSLHKHIDNTELNWMQRLKISVGAARGLNYLHDKVGPQHRVLHRDIKSANILLSDDWEAKVSDFGLCKIGPDNMEFSFHVSIACRTFGYLDPVYYNSGVLTRESDVYSFGVVLFEILCGRLAYVERFQDERKFLGPLAKRSYEVEKLDEIIDPNLRTQMNPNSLITFSAIAYKCLKHIRSERPTMGEILEELEAALEQQVNAPGMERVQHLKIPFKEIILATKNFDTVNFIGKGGFGAVYKGELLWSSSLITVAVKRLDYHSEQGSHEFLTEITMLSSYRHKNLVSLVGFCDEGKDKVLVYVHESRGSLDKYIHNPDLTWMQRLKISIGIARGLHYLHEGVGPQHRVLHRDVKSANILLNDDWEAKISDFGLSKIGPSNLQHTFLVTDAAGTFGYLDPVYYRTGVLTKESDVYSFGVVLFELLCGRLAYEDEKVFLAPLAERKYEENKLDEIIGSELRKQMKLNSLNTFSEIAYQCLKGNRSERPTMARILEKLENAFELQASLKTAEIARVGTWGTTATGGPQNRWAFFLEKDHKLKRITIDHGDLVYSLRFTTESNGVLYTSDKAGGWNGGDTISKVVFEDGEEIIGIDGTVGEFSGYTIISSLSFVTNKRTHGPFGRATETPFSVPWEKGNFGGFYGLAGYYIDAIGVYVKASSKEITRVGIWGTSSPGGPQNQWSFLLERYHHLKMITIDHGDLIYSLMFTTEYRGIEQTSDKAGGWNGGDFVSEVIFAWDEEINGISGTVGVTDAGYTVISSLSFVTNKRTHGPYGRATGAPFRVPWDKGTFVGFYGMAGNYLDGIGVYLKAII